MRARFIVAVAVVFVCLPLVAAQKAIIPIVGDTIGANGVAFHTNIRAARPAAPQECRFA